jgi:2-methylcitrate dehydratase PrpD
VTAPRRLIPGSGRADGAMSTVLTELTPTQRLGGFVAGLAWEDLPVQTRRAATRLTLDLLGVAIRGSIERSSEPVRRLAEGYANESGSSGIGMRTRLVPAAAALVNGTAAHAIELDDVTRESSLHPGVAVIPAALAVAEHRKATGRAFLEAVVAGYEVVIRVGNALNPASTYARGFHPTGVAGAFGAAAAAGHLLSLDGAGITRALGIAGTVASGSLEYLSDGSWTKRLNAGWAAHAGVVAAELASYGFTGPTSALEGRLGALHAYTDEPRAALLTEGLGGSFQINRVAIKPYACCRYNHGLIDGALSIRHDHQIEPAAIRRIRLGVLSAGALLVADPIDQKRVPKNPVDAQFSAPFAAAIALVYGSAGAREYRQEIVDDAQIRHLMSITDCYTSPALDSVYPVEWPAEVEIEMLDGTVYATRVDHALGEPENPLSDEALRRKFRELVGDLLPEQLRLTLEDATVGLEASPTVDGVVDVLRVVRVP